MGVVNGRFEILEILGVGAYAVVCTARDRMSGDRVALKVLRRDALGDASAVARLRDEARILQRVVHPGIARVHELLDYDGRPVLRMELVRGVTLDRLRAMAIRPEMIAAILASVADALRHAWEAPDEDGQPMRIVHRDLKPNNVILAGDGQVKLIDFGIAKGAFAGRLAKSLFAVRGSAGFSAPERRAGQAEQAADVYSLGALELTLHIGSIPLIPRAGAEREEVLEELLGQIQGVDSEQTRARIRAMLAIDADDRPSMSQIVEEYTARAASGPERARFAAEVVGAQEGGPVDSSLDAYRDEVAFLETHSPSLGSSLEPRQAEAAVAGMIATPGWETRMVEIQALLERTGATPPAALIAVLDRAVVPWWKPWLRQASSSELEAALLLLCDRADGDVIGRAQKLRGHPDKRVSAAARFLLGQHG